LTFVAGGRNTLAGQLHLGNELTTALHIAPRWGLVEADFVLA
jgi:hypothetical protein